MWPTRSGYLSLLVLSKWEDRRVGQSLSLIWKSFPLSGKYFPFQSVLTFHFCVALNFSGVLKPSWLLKSPLLWKGVLPPPELLVTAWRPAIKTRIARICLHMVTSFSSSQIVLLSTPASYIHLNFATDGHSLWFHQVLPGYPPFRQFLQLPFPSPGSVLS